MILFLGLSVCMGNVSVTTKEIIGALLGDKNVPKFVNTIVFDLRIPRVLAGILCGAALSVSGLLLQEALSNHLASPSILGINNGAGLFILLSSLLFPGAFVLRSWMAFFGSLCSILFVFIIVRYAGSAKGTFILAGVAVSALMSAGINFIITLRPDAVYDKAAFQLGSLQGVQMRTLSMPLVFILVSLMIVIYLAKGIELFALGDEVAFGLGLNVKRYRHITIFLSVVLAAAAVSICGLVSFVGLIVPNIIRQNLSFHFKEKLVLSVIWGINLMLVGDFLAKSLCYPYELPVGMLISLFGAPFFIFMIIHRRKGKGGAN